MRLYSVLMSVYYKDIPYQLEASLYSMVNQTVPPNQIVLVCDGPLTPDLDKCIDNLKNKLTDLLEVVRLEQNQGLGLALAEGIKHCRNELIARMDSDDISYENRIQKQLEIFEEREDVSIVSGTIEEFEESTDNVVGMRVLPEEHEDIVKFAKYRSPFNHACSMFKKEAVIAAGSYQWFYMMEDYHLWIRMLKAGYKGYNIKEPIIKVRVGAGMLTRRGGVKQLLSKFKFFTYMYKNGMLTAPELLISCIIRTVVTLAPVRLKKIFYSRFARQ